MPYQRAGARDADPSRSTIRRGSPPTIRATCRARSRAAPAASCSSGPATPPSQSGFYLARALAAASRERRRARSRGRGRIGAPRHEGRRARRRYAAVVLLSTRGFDRRVCDALAALPRARRRRARRRGPRRRSVGARQRCSTGARPRGRSIGRTSRSRCPRRICGTRSSGRSAVLSANLGQVAFRPVVARRPERLGCRGAIHRWHARAPGTRRDGIRSGLALFASDLDRRWNDFPLHPAFVPFAIESVRYVIGGDRAGA